MRQSKSAKLFILNKLKKMLRDNFHLFFGVINEKGFLININFFTGGFSDKSTDQLGIFKYDLVTLLTDAE